VVDFNKRDFILFFIRDPKSQISFTGMVIQLLHCTIKDIPTQLKNTRRMDINCSKKSFRDVAIGTKEFNEFNNKDTESKKPNGDILILGVIDQVCILSN
tara:strand:+ start:151 stop:447 length:297 start_codon:yes stop_codon:yes gene_type:complete